MKLVFQISTFYHHICIQPFRKIYAYIKSLEKVNKSKTVFICVFFDDVKHFQ